MQLPQDFQQQLLPYLGDEPTPKETVIVRILESYDEESRANLRSVLNYVFAIPARLFFKDGDRVTFA